jgi:hypothetical protein
MSSLRRDIVTPGGLRYAHGASGCWMGGGLEAREMSIG